MGEGKTGVGLVDFKDLEFNFPDSTYRLMNIPKRYHDVQYSDLKDRDVNEKFFNYIRDFSNQKTKGVFICGPSGSGKTDLAVCMMKQMRAAKRGWPFYLPFSKAVDYKDGKQRINVEFPDTYWSKCCECDLLVVDNIGAENFDFGKKGGPLLLNILRSRYDEILPTIFLTTLLPSEIEKEYGKMLRENIGSKMNICILGDE